MRLLAVISDMLIPAVLFLIIAYGLLCGANIFKYFTEGVLEGVKIVFEIAPTLLGLMVAVGVLRSSGFIDFITNLLVPVATLSKVPVAIIPVILLRCVSASAALSLVFDLFSTYGPDSLIGRMTSIMMGCTETIVYTLTVYFTAIGVKRIRYTLMGAIVVTVSGVVASIVITYWMF